MARIDEIFDRLRRDGRSTLIPFVTAGYPSLDATAEVIPALEAAGADIVEIGFPFSDSIADGPVIAASMHRALETGTTPAAVFELTRRLRRRTRLGLVAMVSSSIVERVGTPRFVAEAAEAGFDGMIVPDLDVPESGPPPAVAELAADAGMTLSLLVAPTTPQDRLRRLASLCRGFLYLLARTGTTGERESIPDLAPRVAAVRRHTDLPVAVGFGITRPEHVAAAAKVAEAVVVGSALVRRLGEAPDPAATALQFTRTLTAALARRG